MSNQDDLTGTSRIVHSSEREANRELWNMKARLAEVEWLLQRHDEAKFFGDYVEDWEHVEHLKSRVESLEQELQNLKRSATWRVGSFLLAPLRALRRIGR